MWVFFPNAFYSIVQDRDDDSRLLVRARFEGDIELYFPGAEVLEIRGADYAFRAFVSRKVVERVMRIYVGLINYPDFKPQVAHDDHVRVNAYYGVWSEMRRAQHEGRQGATARVLVDRTELLALIDAVVMQDKGDAEARAEQLRRMLP